MKYVHLSWFNGMLIGVMLLLSGLASEVFGPYKGTFYFHLAGFTAVCVIFLFFRKSDLNQSTATVAKRYAPWFILPGIVNVCITYTNSIVVPRIGLTVALAAAMLGQLIMSGMMSQYGLLGTPKQAFDKRRLLGIAIIALGLWLMVRF
ncbi:MAG: bacterial/archaeal transporter family-2 protein [Clostridiales bacterium]|nr:bacterial/archaeal transporter family-2 protein [Clostridiales bacterium]MDN5298890.1 bacterial/archaeal transporter family-2 protein [Clostridiales bacterium]